MDAQKDDQLLVPPATRRLHAVRAPPGKPAPAHARLDAGPARHPRQLQRHPLQNGRRPPSVPRAARSRRARLPAHQSGAVRLADVHLLAVHSCQGRDEPGQVRTVGTDVAAVSLL